MFDNYYQDGSSVDISGCTFEDSTANSNGGVLFLSAKTITIEGSTFTNLLSYQNGGSIFIDKVDTLDVSES